MTTYLLDSLDLTQIADDADLLVRAVSRDGAADALVSTDTALGGGFVAYDTPLMQPLLYELGVDTTQYARAIALRPGDVAFVGTVHEDAATTWRYVRVQKAR